MLAPRTVSFTFLFSLTHLHGCRHANLWLKMSERKESEENRPGDREEISFQALRLPGVSIIFYFLVLFSYSWGQASGLGAPKRENKRKQKVKKMMRQPAGSTSRPHILDY
jgi:hypothetical protein